MSDVFANGYAVVIGVDDNQIERFALPTVAKDVQAVYDVLILPERCAYKEEHVRFVKGSESTRKNILDSLFWLQEQAEKDKNATAVVYYSGHGMEDKDAGQYYLIPYDIRSIGRL
ncbi:MAG: caspase family protein, partial [Candidatus Promineifilaceae bacterium]